MSNNPIGHLSALQFHSHTLRAALDAQGKPWFMAEDVLCVLAFKNALSALRRLDDDEKAATFEGLLLSESGVYRQIFASGKPESNALKRWLVEDAIPALVRESRGRSAEACAMATDSVGSVIPFQFGEKMVRTITDEKGEPLFVGKDVCDVLGYADHTNAMKQHCRGVVKYHPILDSIGRARQTRVLSEPDVMRLIVSSKLPAAEAFERLVFEEILPTIRKTGAYTVPQFRELPDHPTLVGLQKQARQSRGLADTSETRVAALIGVQRMIAAVPGVKPAMAAAVALNIIEAETGMNLDAFRAVLPRNSEPMATLNSTGLGALIHEPAVTTNRLLERMGLQKRNARGEWELTDAGKRHGEAFPYTNGRHSGYQILWKHSVAVLLRDPQLHIDLQ